MMFLRSLLLVFLALCFLPGVESLKRSSEVQMTSVSRVISSSKRTAPAAPSHMSVTVAHRLIAGGAARSLAQMTLYPIDAMRTLAQTRDGRTLADVGVSALMRGCTTIQFAVFGACRNTVGPLVASAAGAIGSCVISVPQEVIKQRLVTGVYSSFREAVATIYKTEGVLGFYSAWKPTVLRNVPFVMTTFTTMDIMKRRVLAKDPSGRTALSLWENLSIGIGAAMVGVLVTNPADVIKTRMMTQAASVEVPYASAMDCFTTVLKKEGPLAFFAGVKQRSLYVCLLWGMTFAMNGRIQEYLATR
jgi:solute carrier family 25 S-adenosylmethionine transporter 26